MTFSPLNSIGINDATKLGKMSFNNSVERDNDQIDQALLQPSIKDNMGETLNTKQSLQTAIDYSTILFGGNKLDNINIQ